MFYIYWEKQGRRRDLLVTACDLLSAQFLAAKHSAILTGAVTIYAAATGRPRVPLFIFHGGVPIGQLPNGNGMISANVDHRESCSA